mgnify:CR=1 FL=1
MNIIELEQGSDSWKSWRRTHRMASETPAVTRRSPYQNWEGLRKVKRGEDIANSWILQHGHDYEPIARAYAAAETGLMFTPVIVQEGEYGASLDGLESNSIVEIKCPATGRRSKTWQMAEQGLIPSHYDDQIIHQLAVSGAEICYFTVYDSGSNKGIIIERRPDESAWKNIQKQWDEFWPWHLTEDVDPAKDMRKDKPWREAAEQYVAAKRIADQFAKLAEGHRSRLVELAAGATSIGAGVNVAMLNKAGSIDYKAALKSLAPDADLEAFRKPGTNETRVTIL